MSSTADRGQAVTPHQELEAGRAIGWTARRVASVVIGAVLAVLSLVLLGGGGVALGAANNNDGYIAFGTGARTYNTSGYALTTDGWNASKAFFGKLGTVRIRCTPSDGAHPAFIGLATTGDASRYLANVQHTVVHDGHGGEPTYTVHNGTAPAMPPTQAGIWSAQASGSGVQTLQWRVRDGDWALVGMNADGTPSVSGRVDVSATVPSLPWIAAGLLICGALLLTGAVILIVKPIRGASGRRRQRQVG